MGKYNLTNDMRADAKTFNPIFSEIDLRISQLEKAGSALTKAKDELVALGLAQINPVVAEAVQLIADVSELSNIFEAVSVSEVAIGLGVREFIIEPENRPNFAPAKYLAISVNGELDKWMAGQRQSWNKETGQLIINVTHFRGVGTFDDWLISPTTIPQSGPTVDAYTKTETDTAIADAALQVKDDLVNGAGAAYDTLQELAAELGDNDSAIAALTTALAGKAPADLTNLIGESDLQNNSVTLEKMAHGTQGGIFYFGASGTPSELAAGEAGQVLTCGGPSQNPYFGSILSLGWEPIGAENFTTDLGSIEYADLSDFREILIDGFIRPKSDNVRMMVRTSTDNGTSFDSGASDYEWNVAGGYNAGFVGYSSAADTGLSFTAPIGNLVNEEAHFHCQLREFNQDRYMWATGFCGQENASPTFMSFTTNGTRKDANARNAIRLSASGGDMAEGRFLVFGRRG